MKRLVLSMGMWLAFMMPASANLQQQIDEAKAGATIEVTGEHTGNFVITKPLTLIGKGATLHAEGMKPALTIEQTHDVVVDGISVTAQQRAIVVKDVQNAVIKNIEATGMLIGIQLHRATTIELAHNIIEGTDAHYAKKGNGLALFQSENLHVHDNTITKVQDGIYIEEVKGITVSNNTVTHSRYGTHFMYSDDGVVENNTYEHNVTGLMVMMVDGFIGRGNHTRYHNDMNGSGILFYDVKNARLEGNEIAENRLGLVLQKCDTVRVEGNQFAVNQTALEATRIDDTSLVMANTFTGNILTARSDKQGIALHANYYDDYTGIDADGDGYGDTPYMAYSSFGQWMVRQPAYQYFVASPSVELLTKLDQQTAVAQDVLVDERPKLVAATFTKEAVNYKQATLGGLLFLGTVLLWRRGVKR